MIAVRGHGGERPGKILWRAQISIRILNTAFSCKQCQFSLEIVFIFVHRQTKGFGKVDVVVEYWRGVERTGVVPCRCRHCAGGRAIHSTCR